MQARTYIFLFGKGGRGGCWPCIYIYIYIYIYICIFFFFGGATARGGPWPPLQYASRPLDPLLYLSIRLFPSFSGPWTRHRAISFLVFLFVLLHTAFRTSFLELQCLVYYLCDQAIVLFPFYEPPPLLIIASNSSFRRISIIRFPSLVHIFSAVYSFQILLMLFPLPWWVSTILNHR